MDPSESEEVDILASSQGFLVLILSGEDFSLSLLSVMLFLSLCTCMLSQSCLTLCDLVICSPRGPLSMRFSRQEY